MYGLLYEINKDDESRLDVYEGVPDKYEKQVHTVNVPDTEETREVLVYVDVQRTKPHPTPKHEYIHRMNMAIHDGVEKGVPEAYIKKVLRPYIPEPEE